ncbi:MAG: DUF1883 domain-containing protein [Candidatus Tyrphobacter sp.]
MLFIEAREYLNAGDWVIVTIVTECNVCVMDDNEFTNYRNGRRFRHLGGPYKRSPARIQVPSSGYWNTIDTDGAPANIRYDISYAKKS